MMIRPGVLIVAFFTIASVQCLPPSLPCGSKPLISIHTRGSKRPPFFVTSTTQHVLLSDVARYYVSCRGTNNIEWDYSGHGMPSKVKEKTTVEIRKDGDGAFYCMTSHLTFYPRQSNFDLTKHTGTYTCREIANSSNSASVHIFITRKNTPVFLRSRQHLKLPLSKANLTRSSDTEQAGFYIPCPVSNPTSQVSLLVKRENKQKKKEFLPLKPSDKKLVSFDPKFGFRVNVTSDKLDTVESFHGEYKCTAKFLTRGNSMEDFVLVDLTKPPAYQVYPNTEEVFAFKTLNLTCVADEPIILKEMLPLRGAAYPYFYDEMGLPLDDDYYYSTGYDPGRDEDTILAAAEEQTDQNNFVANFLEPHPIPGAFGEVQCLTEKGKKLIHSWKYQVIGRRQYRLSGPQYDEQDQSFTCIGRSGQPGQVSYVNCHTPNECRINKACLLKTDNCRGYSVKTKALCNRKTKFCGKLLIQEGSGLFRCVADGGVDEIVSFTDEATLISNLNLPSSNQSIATMPKLGLSIGFDTLKPSQTASLKLVPGKNTTPIREGDSITVSLEWGYYFFVEPIQWAIGFKNGTWVHTVPVKENTVKESEFHRVTNAVIRLPSDGQNISLPTNTTTGEYVSAINAINALIPLRSSNEPSWKTIVLPVVTVKKQKEVETEETETTISAEEKIPVPLKKTARFETEVENPQIREKVVAKSLEITTNIEEITEANISGVENADDSTTLPTA